MSSPSTPFQPREIVRVLFLLLIAMLAAHYTMIASAFVITQGRGDSVLANYLLEHDWRWLIRSAPDTSLFSPPMFYPVPDTAGYSDLFVGALPFYGVWRAMGALPQTAFQFFLLTVSALNFLSTYVLLRIGLKTSAASSAIAAILFAFGSPRMMQIDHVQMVAAFYVVWAMTGLWLMFGEPRRLWTGAMLLTISVVLQFYTAFYYAWFMAFAALVALAYALISPGKRRALGDLIRTGWLPLACAAAVGAVLLAPGALEYHKILKEVGARSYAEVVHFLPIPEAWFAQGPDHLIYGRLNRLMGITENFGMQEMFNGIGLLTTGLVVAGFLKFWKRPAIALWGAVAAAAILLTLAWRGHSAWAFVFPVLPGASAVRAIGRFGVFLLLPEAMGLALILDWMANRFSPLLALGCALIVFAEQAGTFPAMATYNKNQFQASIAGVAKSAGPECKTLLFSWTAGATSVPWMHLIGMWAEQFSRVPSLNGYSGQAPPNWPLSDVSIVNRFDRMRLYDSLRAWMLSHPDQIENVCWISPGSDAPDVVRREDLAPDAFALRKAHLALLGRLPDGPRAASIRNGAQGRPEADVAEIEALPEFREREQFVFAAYRLLFGRDPDLPSWIHAVQDFAAKRKTAAQLVEDWQKSDECRQGAGCSRMDSAELIRAAGPALPRPDEDRIRRVLLYYCLAQRPPGPNDTDDSALIHAVLEPAAAGHP